MATFSQAMPSAFIPMKFTIQYTTNEPLPYAVAFTAGSTCDAGGELNGIWKASDTNEYVSDTKKYVVIVAASLQTMNCQKRRGGWPAGMTNF